MPITTDKDSKVVLFCEPCEGDGEVYTGSDYGHKSTVGVYPKKCEKCSATGRIAISTQEWMQKHLNLEPTNKSGLYSFDDMVKAFELGVKAECGDLPHQDYIGAIGIIKKYFSPLTHIQV